MDTDDIEITAEALRQIELAAGYGLPDSEIAVLVGIELDTLLRNCKTVLAKGRAMGNAKIAQAITTLAISGKCPQATIFAARARLGWRDENPPEEQSTTKEHVSVTVVCKDLSTSDPKRLNLVASNGKSRT